MPAPAWPLTCDSFSVQVEGIRFIWQHIGGSPGSGCVLADYMGLGKTWCSHHHIYNPYTKKSPKCPSFLFLGHALGSWRVARPPSTSLLGSPLKKHALLTKGARRAQPSALQQTVQRPTDANGLSFVNIVSDVSEYAKFELPDYYKEEIYLQLVATGGQTICALGNAD